MRQRGYRSTAQRVAHQSKVERERAEYLRSLGYRSNPFKARFNGICPLTGTRYLRGEADLAFFRDYEKPLLTTVIDTIIRAERTRVCVTCGSAVDTVHGEREAEDYERCRLCSLDRPETETLFKMCELNGVNPFGWDCHYKLFEALEAVRLELRAAKRDARAAGAREPEEIAE